MPNIDQISNGKRMREEVTTIEQFEAIGSYSDVAKQYMVSSRTGHALKMSLRAKKAREVAEVTQVLSAEEVIPVHPEVEIKVMPEEGIDRGKEATPAPYPGCFSESNQEKYWCNDCEYKAECLTMFKKINPEPQGMTEEENTSDTEWETKNPLYGKELDSVESEFSQEELENQDICAAIDYSNSPEGMIEQMWCIVESDLDIIHKLYLKRAEDEFKARSARVMAC